MQDAQTVLNESPDHTAALQIFGMASYETGNCEEVRVYLHSLSANSILQSIQAYERTLSYNTVMTAFRIGTAYKELSNYSKSVQYFTMSQQLDPTFAATYQYRGQVHYSAGETSLAIEDFSRCIEHAPWLESKLHMNCH